MKTSSLIQYIVIILTAALLIFLFSKSQVDNIKHEETLINILSTLQHDSKIKHQIVELQNGYKQNYGGLVAINNHIKFTFNRFSDTDDIINLSFNKNINLILTGLEEEFKIKFNLVELFKRENAILRNSLHYLPKLIQQTGNRVDRKTTLTTNDILIIKNNLASVLNEILRYDSKININKIKLTASLNKHYDDLQFITSKDLLQDIDKIFKHARLIIKLKGLTSSHIQKILSNKSTSLIKSLYHEFNLSFQLLETTAATYQNWMFAISLMLLIYLMIIFLKLQTTSNTLKKSLVDLEFQKDAIDQHSIVSITDVKGKILYANDKFCDISQYSQEELLGKNHRIVRSQIHDNEYFKSMWKTIAHGNIWHGTFANKAKDGSTYWVDSTILPRLNEQGKPYQYIGIRTDITAQKLAEEKADLLARFPAENPDPVLRLDDGGYLLYSNPASQSLLQYWGIVVADRLPREWLTIALHCLEKNEQEEHEIKVDDIFYSILFSPVSQEKYINLYARDITEIKLAEQNLSYQAKHDNLTSLYNRYAFELKLEESLKISQFSEVDSILLYIDLDQFKIVNDSCGHIAGDELLRQISQEFSIIIRDNDTLARLGGDEFGVILNNCDMHHGKLIANKVLSSINHFRFLWEDSSFEIGASIGLVEITKHSDSTVSLLGKADIACYAAKDAGRNRLKIYQQDEIISKRKDEMQWASFIPRALEENKFILFAQLIKSLDPTTSKHSHYEILIRLVNDDNEVIPPGAFIPAAERYGLMNSIDLWVIEESLKQLCYFNLSQPDSPIKIAMNLSGQSIGNKLLVEFITSLFDKYHINATHITFEITETAAIINLSAAIIFIKELKLLGCKFALDDFGSGLSSFAYLKNLPVDFLKIDGAFVKDILDDPIDEAMVESINQIGHVMNIKTIAEFVENKQIEQRLAQMKVDFVQGYGVEKPRPFSEILYEAELHKKIV